MKIFRLDLSCFLRVLYCRSLLLFCGWRYFLRSSFDGGMRGREWPLHSWCSGVHLSRSFSSYDGLVKLFQFLWWGPAVEIDCTCLLLNSCIYFVINPTNHLILMFNLCRWLLMEVEKIIPNKNKLNQIHMNQFGWLEDQREYHQIQSWNRETKWMIYDNRKIKARAQDLAIWPDPCHGSAVELGGVFAPLCSDALPCLLFGYKHCIFRCRKGRRLG